MLDNMKGTMMHIILGGTGRVGSATVRALLRRGEQVTIVTRDASHCASLTEAGAQVAVADIRDVTTLREIFRSGTTAFLLNPPALPSGDTDAEERANVAAITEALNGSGLQKVVAASTYGARSGPPCGDLTVLFEFEEKLRAQAIPVAVNRAAYYLSNWGEMIDTVRTQGKLPSFFPAELAFPMVAPEDLGEAAARRLLEPPGETGILHIEGPQWYTPRDVAEAVSVALNMTIEVEIIPRPMWEQTFRQLGFSESAAQTYACMTATVLDDERAWPSAPARGTTTLQDYIHQIVKASG